jgi:hypothetical protein
VKYEAMIYIMPICIIIGTWLAKIKVGSNGLRKIRTMFFMLWPTTLSTFDFSPLVEYDVEPLDSCFVLLPF